MRRLGARLDDRRLWYSLFWLSSPALIAGEISVDIHQKKERGTIYLAKKKDLGCQDRKSNYPWNWEWCSKSDCKKDDEYVVEWLTSRRSRRWLSIMIGKHLSGGSFLAWESGLVSLSRCSLSWNGLSDTENSLDRNETRLHPIPWPWIRYITITSSYPSQTIHLTGSSVEHINGQAVDIHDSLWMR